MSTKTIKQAVQLLKRSQYAVALTGAGISTPSGIPDFRSPTSGLWNNHDPFLVASIFALRKHPQGFYQWMHPLAKQILEAEPNPAHIALAKLEKMRLLEAIITQNIDMLHHRAGSENVYEVHGHLRCATCLDCGREARNDKLLADFVATAELPRCAGCGGILKPNIILFGEMLPEQTLKSAELATLTCDLMLVVGSSLEVLPIGDMPRIAKQNGASLIIVDLFPTRVDEIADVVIRGDVAEILPLLAAPFE